MYVKVRTAFQRGSRVLAVDQKVVSAAAVSAVVSAPRIVVDHVAKAVSDA